MTNMSANHYIRGAKHYAEGKYEDAASEYRQAVDAADVQDPELHIYLGALTRLLEWQGKFQDSANAHDDVRGRASALPASHPIVIRIQMNHGRALMKAGKLSKAAAALGAAQRGIEAAGAAPSLEAGILETLLSDLAYLQPDAPIALEHGQAALDIYRKVRAPEYRFAEAYTSIANAEFKAGRSAPPDSAHEHYARALDAYEMALALRRSIGGNHYQVGVNQGSVAEVLLAMSRRDEAKQYATKAMAIIRSSAPNDQVSLEWISKVCNDAAAA